MNLLTRLGLIAALLCVLGLAMLVPHFTHTQAVAHRTVSSGKTSMFAAHFYWSGVVVTLNRNDELLAAIGQVPVTAILSIFGPGGDFAALGVATSAGHAWWNYVHHQCDWFWIPWPSYGTPGTGQYAC